MTSVGLRGASTDVSGFKDDVLSSRYPVAIAQELGAFIAIEDDRNDVEPMVARVFLGAAGLQRDHTGRPVQQQNRHHLTLSSAGCPPRHNFYARRRPIRDDIEERVRRLLDELGIRLVE